VIRALRAVVLRAALCGQVALALMCIDGARLYTVTWCHPLGREETALRWAPAVSALLVVYVFAEACMATVAPWRRTLIVIGSLLLVLIAIMAANLALVRY
jgi:hypothetical protein